MIQLGRQHETEDFDSEEGINNYKRTLIIELVNVSLMSKPCI